MFVRVEKQGVEIMDKYVFRFFGILTSVLISSAAQAAGWVSVSTQVDTSVLYARIAEIIFVLEMVKLPIVLPILP
jgi:hypothetical protein